MLNNEFWNPVLLAREAATADILTAGRLELGFGAGHAAVEFAAAGIAYDRPGLRIDRLAAAVPVVRTLIEGGTVDVDATYGLEAASLGFAAAQPRIPVMIGGNGDRVLRLAAQQADIVGLTGFTSGTGRTHTDLSHFTWDGLADRIDHVRRHAGERFADLELSVLVQAVRRCRRPPAAAVDFAQGMIEDVEALLDSPFLLLGTDRRADGPGRPAPRRDGRHLRDDVRAGRRGAGGGGGPVARERSAAFGHASRPRRPGCRRPPTGRRPVAGGGRARHHVGALLPDVAAEGLVGVERLAAEELVAGRGGREAPVLGGVGPHVPGRVGGHQRLAVDQPARSCRSRR